MTFFGHLLYPFRFPNRLRNVAIKGKVSFMLWSELWLFTHHFSRKLTTELCCVEIFYTGFYPRH